MINISQMPSEHARQRGRRPATRRLDILKIAAEVFLESGYEAGAMSEIARRLGGSKGTLYSYFPSKQALFAAVVQEGAARHGREIFGGISDSGDLAFDLAQVGRALLTGVTSDAYLALRRAVIAEAGKSEFGKFYFEQGRRSALAPVAVRLAKAMEQGRLRRADPWEATMHFRGLCLSDLYDLRLEGVIEALKPREIARAADEAVDVFFRAYAVLPPIPPFAPAAAL
jgi:AcrR family transcriptional regulator